MATLLFLIGGILGFFSSIAAYTLFDASLMTALMIWVASGPVAALISVILRLMPQTMPQARSRAPHQNTETA